MKTSLENNVHVLSLLMFWIFSSIWQQFFIFSKTIYLPIWASSWPLPVFIGSQVAFASIAVTALAEKNEDLRYKRVLLSPFVMPISAVIFHALKLFNEGNSAEHITSNIVANYLYIALFVCLIPSIIVLTLHEIFSFVKIAMKKVFP